VGDGDEVRRRLDRDREAEALGVARDRGVDADDGARRVEERAAAVAGVDRGVGLEEVVELDRLAGLLVLDVMLRPVAEMIPFVTVSVNVPSGLPIAIAVWPTWMPSESPSVAALRPVASILIRARSLSSAILTIWAGYSVPSLRATVSDWLPLTTWRFVRM
jgi:hypothetical protein